ncbi:MAG: hypothetical protein Tsb0019_13350 [Roseibium sp.]
MLKYSTILLAFACLAGPARADVIPMPGDIYLISRDRFGYFVGSHKLYQEQSRGLKKVSYCSRDYFVRSHSVAWAQLETERGNRVRIEYNFGRGWRPICDNPQRQVTLEDLGIKLSPEDVIAQAESGDSGQNRLSAIGAMFQLNREGGAGNTYHTR